MTVATGIQRVNKPEHTGGVTDVPVGTSDRPVCLFSDPPPPLGEHGASHPGVLSVRRREEKRTRRRPYERGTEQPQVMPIVIRCGVHAWAASLVSLSRGRRNWLKSEL